MNKKKRVSSPTAIWIMLVIALLVFAVLKYKLSNDLATAKQKLSDATTAREEQLAVIAQGEQLMKRLELTSQISSQNRSLTDTLRAFSNPEMSNALTQRIEIPSDVGVLIAKKSDWSHYVWTPKGQQNIVLYAKLFSEDTKGTQLELISEPDHRIEIPLTPEQLTVVTHRLRETDSGVELFWQLGEQKPTTIPFKGFSSSGWSSWGINNSETFQNTLGDCPKFWILFSRFSPDSKATLLKKGIWKFVASNSFNIKSDKEAKQLQVAIVLESSGPFYVSSLHKYHFIDGFELTWEEAQAAFRVELKSE